MNEQKVKVYKVKSAQQLMGFMIIFGLHQQTEDWMEFSTEFVQE